MIRYNRPRIFMLAIFAALAAPAFAQFDQDLFINNAGFSANGLVVVNGSPTLNNPTPSNVVTGPTDQLQIYLALYGVTNNLISSCPVNAGWKIQIGSGAAATITIP
ncbi:MAG TPA: hypothetical protein VG273_25220, partial [Bryobacteraceae bacterium]|nr:hypothetical protein [Bryobacteraceae bacterium]